MISDTIKEQIKNQSHEEYPKEACGVVVVFKGRQQYIKCRNINELPDTQVTFSPEDLAAAESKGEIIYYVHSHTLFSEEPSQTDRLSQSRTGVPWIIYSTITDKFFEFSDSEKLPLFGRPYVHMVTDCYDFIRDYYQEELKISIPNYFRTDNWWDKGEDLYVKNYSSAGFRQVSMSEARHGDVLILQLNSPVPNHGGIYLDGNKIAHHLANRISSVDIYGDFLRDRTRLILRHFEMDERHAKKS